MLTMRVLDIDHYGDLNINATADIRTALRQWVVGVVIAHIFDKPVSLVDEIHYALEHYSNGQIYNLPAPDVDHIVNEMIGFYNRSFEHFAKYQIIHHDISSPYREGVYLVTREL